MELLATAATGTAGFVATECRRLGLQPLAVRSDGVLLDLEPAQAAHALVHLRVATRLLLLLDDIECPDADAFYESLSRLFWPDWLDDRHTLAVRCSGALPGSPEAPPGRRSHGPPIANHVFASQRAKDAICDRLRQRYGARPSVDLDDPDVTVHVRFAGDRATVALDLCGEPLHQRGYRVAEAEAPIKEHLAAAIAIGSGWDGGGPLLDPLCGSGTLLIEAVLNHLSIAPGRRRDFAVERWPWHGPLFGKLLDEAREAAQVHATAAVAGAGGLDVLGLDFDRGAVRTAKIQVQRAGLADLIRVERGDARRLEAPPPGTVILTNPPYGVRLLAGGDNVALYRELGQRFATFEGVDLHIVDGHEAFLGAFGATPLESLTMRNGALPISLRHMRFGQWPVTQATGRLRTPTEAPGPAQD